MNPSIRVLSQNDDMDVDEDVNDHDTDSELSCRESEDDEGGNPRLHEAIGGVEDMIISFLSQVSDFGRTSRTRSNSDMTRGSGSEDISPRPKSHRRKSKIELRLANRSKEVDAGMTPSRCVKYPKKCANGSIRPMAQLLRVLDLTHEALVDNVPTTKRDMYYKDVPLFRSQRTVDSLVDDLAATFELERSDLNIRAASKGLVCGSGLVAYLRTGETLQINDTEGTLIPVGEDIKSFKADTNLAWVLVVEKEAIFQTLCRLKFTCHPSLPGRGLIITGKGYPDIATRHFVRTLADALPLCIPILVMVDGDPYGMDILSVYKFGSRRLQHENTKLAAGRIEWLGLHSSELESYGIDRDRLLPITQHDEAKALSMLRRPRATMPKKWRKEIMHILHTRRKAEIEILSTKILDLSAYVAKGSIPFDMKNADEAEVAMADTLDDHLVASLHDSTSCSPASDMAFPTRSPSSPTAASFSDLSPHTSPPSSPSVFYPPVTLVPTHALLLRYLVCKITERVTSSRARAQSFEQSI